MTSSSSVKQLLLEKIADLPDDRLSEVLQFVDFLLYSQQSVSIQQDRENSESIELNIAQDPLTEFIGAVSHDSIAHNLNEAVLYPL